MAAFRAGAEHVLEPRHPRAFQRAFARVQVSLRAASLSRHWRRGELLDAPPRVAGALEHVAAGWRQRAPLQGVARALTDKR